MRTSWWWGGGGGTVPVILRFNHPCSTQVRRSLKSESSGRGVPLRALFPLTVYHSVVQIWVLEHSPSPLRWRPRTSQQEKPAGDHDLKRGQILHLPLFHRGHMSPARQVAALLEGTHSIPPTFVSPAPVQVGHREVLIRFVASLTK